MQSIKKEVKQRSEDWFKMREGRFTASQISRLLGKETLKATQKSIKAYAHEKAVESIFGREPELEYLPKDMQRGVDLEPMAFEKFAEISERDYFTTTKECGFFPYNDNAGASPDGLVGDTSILEIKCPQRAKFFKYVIHGANEIDLKYMAQMQMQMLCTDTSLCYFMNYIIHEGREMWHIIEVARDEDMIEVIKNRIDLATAYKLEYINTINNNKQF